MKTMFGVGVAFAFIAVITSMGNEQAQNAAPVACWFSGTFIFLACMAAIYKMAGGEKL